jgi:NitT/TauT family transport system ATP-binding protein
MQGDRPETASSQTGSRMTSVRPDAYIRFEGVDFRHSRSSPGSALVLRDLTLSLDRGEFFCLLGPSGCGKTTVLNLLAGFETPLAGGVWVDGSLITAPGVDRVVIFQGDDSLYHWLTAVQNVEFPLMLSSVSKRERRARAQQYIDLVGLASHAQKYPGQLSGGMKQRIQIARALVGDSPVLLMDEPFGALDAQNRSILQDELAKIWQQTQRTVLFITHDISEAITLADRIGIMTAGPEASIKEIIDTPLPRPRRRGDPAFGELYDRINTVVSSEVTRALRRELAEA